MNRLLSIVCLLALLTTAAFASTPAQDAPKPLRPYRLPCLEPMPQILWGSECAPPTGAALRFGGQDQASDEGAVRTALNLDGKWTPITEELRKANLLQPFRDRIWALRDRQQRTLAKARWIYFQGLPSAEEAQLIKDGVGPECARIGADTQTLIAELNVLKDLNEYQAGQIKAALLHLADAEASDLFAAGVTPDVLKGMLSRQIGMEQAAEFLDAEPAPRALSPLVYDAKTNLFFLFGGDHLDYLTNDIWVFDPAAKRWAQRHPQSTPAPRGNHKLSASGDGKILLSGGYTYSNTTDYCGGPYIDLGDGEWTYDIAANTWTSSAGKQGSGVGQRVYRTGPFHPDFFTQGEKPDAAAWAAKLNELPVNSWVAIKPPQTLHMNRDWGTAVIDPNDDVLLRFSGGHSAHGGTDVPMYHFATNRWELPFPIEFPLGQTYSNTSYPGGFNLNRRPWISCHTYKGYDYDPASKQMVYVGQRKDCFLFDPVAGDWNVKFAKPKGMDYGGCCFTLMCKRMSNAVVCWNQYGQLFQYNGQSHQWDELKVAGEKLPESAVDSAGIDYDAKRDRLLLFPVGYGQKYNGQIVVIDMKELKATRITPQGTESMAGKLNFMRETCYDAENDVVLCGSNIVQADGTFQTVLFDCATDEWKCRTLPGANPAGKAGRDVSMGLVYDAKRKLAWSTDTNGNMYVLRLNMNAVK